MTTSDWQTPDWVKHAVFYQIFPERFANGDRTNDPANAQPWGTSPTLYNYMGGDLQGIIDKLDYLVDLGINALYLNPIFQATTSHKYNTFDYFKIDPHFGTLETFKTLLNEAHRRGIKVILDAVFNHCGRGFFAFHDVIENGVHSPYTNWFHISRFPIHPYESRYAANYRTWWDFRELPKFNTDNPAVRKYLLDVARYWIELGIDGWRLDVPNEIDDHNFWREFRTIVKDINPEAYIVGEIWTDGSAWLQGDQFDAVMNYLFRDLCTDFFASYRVRAADFAAGIDHLIVRYQPQVTYVQFNLLGSHDTARFLSVAEEAGKWALERMKLAVLFKLIFPGAPCIYYGDEIGLHGGKDPDCRRCFPWDQPQTWQTDLQAWTKRWVKFRHEHTALRTGHYATLFADNDMNIFACARWDEQSQFVIVLNNNETPWTLDLPLHAQLPSVTHYRDVQTGELYSVAEGKIREVALAPWKHLVLQAE
ncbi:MAG TPA: glycoside hydrolase family 13 protein [Herpetosiphon sp.]|uniref:Alpha amylase catalytic region n=1 Tax=Herpetosiphon aurantiacus (strain ATCC 23779 / DSM 785 / 114-95) TaxID=316274 RepID=A9B4Y8_HERA2|nr:glycoside hydrolase family 13 protein [Herpetosiphon sp.]ABX05711.1 alpha amylase catalytic region [Herpetosiphon aurantiacus DSM 785]HBW49348.1 glycoside hydrolase family 13 protein [Herpetosiphon sp.]